MSRDRWVSTATVAAFVGSALLLVYSAWDGHRDRTVILREVHENRRITMSENAELREMVELTQAVAARDRERLTRLAEATGHDRRRCPAGPDERR